MPISHDVELIVRRRAAAAFVLIAFAGCGAEAGGESSGRVEELVKRDLVKALLDEGGTPSEAEIEDAADKVEVSCRAARAADYECTLDSRELGERPPCTVRVNSLGTRITSMRCGGSREAPVTHEEYVDCSTIGQVVQVTDPAADLNENQRPLDPTVARREELKKTDLRAMRVAATPQRLCVEWETAAPIQPKHAFNLWTYPDNRPDGGITLAVKFEARQAPDIGLFGRGSTSGRVGTRGRLTSLLIEADDLPQEWRAGLGERFTFSAQSAWIVGRTDPDQAYGDRLPDGLDRPAYPG